LLSLTLPSPYRERLWVCGAINVELSRITEMSEPATRAIRLKWWEEALAEPRNHPIANAWHDGFADSLTTASKPLICAIYSREIQLEGQEWFIDMKALDHYATQSGGFWAAISDDPQAQQWLASLGQVYALQGLLWATGYYLHQGILTLPRELCDAHGFDPLNPKADEDDREKIWHLIRILADRTERSLELLLEKTASSQTPLLHRAIPPIRWRCQTLQKHPHYALMPQPPAMRWRALYHNFIAR